MRISLVMLLAGALACASCGGKRTHSSPPAFTELSPAPPSNFRPAEQKVIVTPDTGLTGKVVKANAEGRFVVLNFPIGHLPSLGQPLNLYRLGLKVGELKVVGPQLDDNIVADLVAGEARSGDEARER